MRAQEKGFEIFYPKTKQDWRKWLEENHQLQKGVWIVQYKKKLDVPTISWIDAVDEALCFGWIDSIRKSLNDNQFIQFFSKRKAISTWSKINKAKIVDLIANDLMTAEGYESINIAKANGSWTILDEVEELIIPKDLAAAFNQLPEALTFFLSLSKSVKKSILQWLVFAKRAETRQKRIAEIVSLAAQNLKPKQFR